jgi:hypothetical protein
MKFAVCYRLLVVSICVTVGFSSGCSTQADETAVASLPAELQNCVDAVVDVVGNYVTASGDSVEVARLATLTSQRFQVRTKGTDELSGMEEPAQVETWRASLVDVQPGEPDTAGDSQFSCWDVRFESAMFDTCRLTARGSVCSNCIAYDGAWQVRCALAEDGVEQDGAFTKAEGSWYFHEDAADWE